DAAGDPARDGQARPRCRAGAVRPLRPPRQGGRMSAARFAIDRVEVTLLGVPLADAESTASALEAALMDRFGAWRPDLAGAMPMDIRGIDLGSVDLSAQLDAVTLATLLAERLGDRLEEAAAHPWSAG